MRSRAPAIVLSFSLLVFVVVRDRLTTAASPRDTTTWGANDPTWSPDGKRIAFTLFGSIWTVDAQGGEAAQLSTSGQYHAHPSWSPKGDWIAFIDGNPPAGPLPNIAGRLFIVNTSTGEERHLRTAYPTAGTPTWSPDGSILYFVSDRDGFRCLWAQRLNPASKRPVSRPFAVRHFHQLRHSLLQTISSPPEAVGLSVTRDRLYFSVDDMTGNIWIAKWQ